MNFTEENEELRQNLLNLLNSNDEANVAVGANILWDLSIPDDWVFFLFEKAHRSPSITSLLRKHFPEKEFESAYIWFRLKEVDWQERIEHLAELHTLHKDFTPENLFDDYAEEFLGSWNNEYMLMSINYIGDMPIPDKWVLRLFTQAHEKPIIADFLRKKFPQKEFEPAHIWFSLKTDTELAQHFDCLLALPALHLAFSWENLLPLYVAPITQFWGEKAGSGAELGTKIFDYKPIPVHELIRMRIFREWITLPTPYLPSELQDFPELTCINTLQSFYDLPFWVVEMPNLISIGINGVSVSDLTIAGEPFIRVMKRHRLSYIINWFTNNGHSINYIDVDEEKLKLYINILREGETDERILRYAEMLCSIIWWASYESYEEAEAKQKEFECYFLETITDLYENHHFFETWVGSNISMMTHPIFSPYFPSKDSLFDCVIQLFEKNSYSKEWEYIYTIKKILQDSFDNNPYTSKIALRASNYVAHKFQNERYRQEFLFWAIEKNILYICSIDDSNNGYGDYTKLNTFYQDFDQNFCDIGQEYEMGLIYTSEYWNKIRDRLDAQYYKNKNYLLPIIEQYKHYLPAL